MVATLGERRVYRRSRIDPMRASFESYVLRQPQILAIPLVLALLTCGPQANPASATTSPSASIANSTLPSASPGQSSKPSPTPIPPKFPMDFLANEQCRAAGECPPISCFASEFDPIRREIIFFGGCLPSEPRSDATWRYKDGTWTRLFPSDTPPARGFAAMAFDEALGVIVMYGGSDVPDWAAEATVSPDIAISGDTWTWDGSDWTEQHPAHHPVLFGPSATYDYARHQIVLIGVTPANTMQTWTYDGVDWTHRALADRTPTPWRIYERLSFGPASSTVATFGGYNPSNADISAVWKWDGRTWTKTLANAPPAISGLASFAPEFAQKSILICSDTQPATTWLLNLSGFRQVHPVHQPGTCAGMSPDRSRDRVLVYGWTEFKGDSWQFEVWFWSGSDWTATTV